MRITYKGDYALKTILDLSLHYQEEPVSIPELAQRADIPIKFLEQILLELKQGGFVQSRRGKVGGYLLARPPSEIRLGEVVRFIDGGVTPVACTDKDYQGCKDMDGCVFRGIWQQVARATENIIDKVTFEDLAKRERRMNSAYTYQI